MDFLVIGRPELALTQLQQQSDAGYVTDSRKHPLYFFGPLLLDEDSALLKEGFLPAFVIVELPAQGLGLIRQREGSVQVVGIV
ncbi:MAG: hypothetical protein ICV83_00215 [Cytophagales bacterium]|nr:hypothetical protein [Cytophagales bacterium]